LVWYFLFSNSDLEWFDLISNSDPEERVKKIQGRAEQNGVVRRYPVYLTCTFFRFHLIWFDILFFLIWI
jgi:hypothetical protein